MKKILIISYYFPPVKAVAGHRPKSFAENFSKHGLFPIVLTRHWQGNEHSEVSDDVWGDFRKPSLEKDVAITEEANYKVIRVPYQARKYEQLSNIKNSLLRKYSVFQSSLQGDFHIETDAYEMLEAAERILETEDIDCILVTSAPLNIVRLGAELSNKYKKKLVVDFRDLWDNRILSDSYKLTSKETFLRIFQEFHVKKWLKSADLLTSVSQPLLNELTRLNPQARSLVVTNGYEKTVFDQVVPIENGKFTFSVIGTLYPHQDLSILIEGLEKFLADKNLNEIQLNFVGTGIYPEIENLLKSKLPSESLYVSGRLPHQEALGIMFGSTVLFYAGWRGFKGILSGKIFEYIAAKKNILIAPGDANVIDDLVNSTKTGKIANSAVEFSQIMNDWFNEWKTSGVLKWTGDVSKINFYSRENQAQILAEEIKEILR